MRTLSLWLQELRELRRGDLRGRQWTIAAVLYWLAAVILERVTR